MQDCSLKCDRPLSVWSFWWEGAEVKECSFEGIACVVVPEAGPAGVSCGPVRGVSAAFVGCGEAAKFWQRMQSFWHGGGGLPEVREHLMYFVAMSLSTLGPNACSEYDL